MSKLPKEYEFIDLSDYGRPIARIIANALKETPVTPVHVTLGFVVAGLIATACILTNNLWAAAVFLILKSILDAADGELARVKNTASYTGRYLDSVSDILLNFMFLFTIAYITETSYIYALIAFFAIQLQGTLYNYYYVILRTRLEGDTTSRIFEYNTPTALPGEKQHTVNFLFRSYKFLYGNFDRVIYFLDTKATIGKLFPKWFMTCISVFGLGFQLLIISAMLVLGWAQYIIPFFAGFSILIFVFIATRKLL
jgi:hypothetical protein